MKRKSKFIKDKKDIEYLVNLTEDEITLSFIMKSFGEFKNNRRFNPYDLITLPPNSYNNNKNSFTTTIGLYIFNKYFIEKDLFHIFRYFNKTVNGKTYKKMNSILSYALLEDKITLEQMKRFLLKVEKFMPFVSIISPSHTLKMLTSTKSINEKKEELKIKYKDSIEKGDPVGIEKMEKELKDFAREYLKDDPSMDSYNSGARGSFDNNFKNMYIMKGTMRDPDPDKGYKVALSNYMDGISKEEYKDFANSLVEGPYARGVKTQVGGYLEKQFVSAFNHVVLDKAGSDCRTKRYVNVKITDNNKKYYMYCYIIERNKLIELTSDNIDKYIGKNVKMRFSSLCESKTGICNKCAGNLFYRLGIMNIGTAMAIPSSVLKNLSMKSFHNSQIVSSEMNVMKAFSLD